jgi:chemotaxis protein histidine kinase CheA
MPDDGSTGEEFLAEFLDDYFAESDEHLTAVRHILLELEPESGVAGISPAMLEELFRSFHSLKGLAGMVHLRRRSCCRTIWRATCGGCGKPTASLPRPASMR